MIDVAHPFIKIGSPQNPFSKTSLWPRVFKIKRGYLYLNISFLFWCLCFTLSVSLLIALCQKLLPELASDWNNDPQPAIVHSLSHITGDPCGAGDGDDGAGCTGYTGGSATSWPWRSLWGVCTRLRQVHNWPLARLRTLQKCPCCVLPGTREINPWRWRESDVTMTGR